MRGGLAALLLGLCSVPASGAELLVFSAMGCGPYTPADEAALRFFLKQENELAEAERSAFLVHLGDINSGGASRLGLTQEDHYEKTAELLASGGDIPMFVVPGDNEWNDHADPDAAWGWWTTHLLKLDERWQVDWKVLRQRGREENFAFVRGGVLVVGINFVGGLVHDAAEWRRRLADDLRWVDEMFTAAKGRPEGVKAAVVLCQANPSVLLKKEAGRSFGREFIDGIAARAKAFGQPVLLLHADGHKWIENRGWQDVPNLTRVQTDLITPTFPPLQVVVAEHEGAVTFEFRRRLGDRAWKPPVAAKED